jgi:hypothetical protein
MKTLSLAASYDRNYLSYRSFIMSSARSNKKYDEFSAKSIKSPAHLTKQQMFPPPHRQRSERTMHFASTNSTPEVLR